MVYHWKIVLALLLPILKPKVLVFMMHMMQSVLYLGDWKERLSAFKIAKVSKSQVKITIVSAVNKKVRLLSSE